MSATRTETDTFGPIEEFMAWQRSIDRHGLAGLRTTRLQQYR